MKELKCKKCDEKMMKKGIIQSGNSKYDIYRCNECGHEEMKAIGVNPRGCGEKRNAALALPFSSLGIRIDRKREKSDP